MQASDRRRRVAPQGMNRALYIAQLVHHAQPGGGRTSTRMRVPAAALPMLHNAGKRLRCVAAHGMRATEECSGALRQQPATRHAACRQLNISSLETNTDCCAQSRPAQRCRVSNAQPVHSIACLRPAPHPAHPTTGCCCCCWSRAHQPPTSLQKARRACRRPGATRSHMPAQRLAQTGFNHRRHCSVGHPQAARGGCRRIVAWAQASPHANNSQPHKCLISCCCQTHRKAMRLPTAHAPQQPHAVGRRRAHMQPGGARRRPSRHQACLTPSSADRPPRVQG